MEELESAKNLEHAGVRMEEEMLAKAAEILEDKDHRPEGGGEQDASGGGRRGKGSDQRGTRLI